MKTLFAALVLFLTAAVVARAEVKPNSLFNNNAVLQQDMEVPVWGTANDGEKVTVKFQGQEVSTVTKAGRWLVKLKPMKAGGPFDLTIAGSNTIDLKDIYVGEVWLCSGQSNMGWQLIQAANSAEELANANHPDIHLFIVPPVAAGKPELNVQGHWNVSGPKTAAGFSAVAYFFGRHLAQTQHVPIGLIHSSWGGTPAEAWTSTAALDANPAFKPFSDEIKASDKAFADSEAAYREQLDEWKTENDKLVADHMPEIPKPKPPQYRGITPIKPAVLYNGMISPLAPFAIRGVIWYQGEANAGRAAQYRQLFPTMIKSWRTTWRQDFPFLFVQLANFTATLENPGDSPWAELREAQTMTLSLPKTAMAVAIDIGDAGSIHPLNKQDVGLRLGLAAQATVYGEKIEYSGPMFQSMSIKGNQAVLQFTHADGLNTRSDDKVKGFAIAGPDKKFVWANAKIESNTVVVWSDSIPEPVAVRYAWADNPVCNLYNKANLPASPFRTDQPEK